MAIKVKAIERNVSFTKGEEKWAYVLQADLYIKLSADKVIQEAALRSGIIMAFMALLMPPPGQIHDSVLYIFAQILIYCGSIFGLDSYISRKLRDMNPPNHPKPL